MKKTELVGILLAFVLMLGALAARRFGAAAARIALPVFAAALWTLMGIDISAYKKEKNPAGLIRIISVGVVALLTTFASVLAFAGRFAV